MIEDTFEAQCEDKNCDVPRGHDGDHSDGNECWPRETEATLVDRLNAADEVAGQYVHTLYKEAADEIERLNALVTKGRTLNDLERLMEENERLRKALDEIETLAANDTCGCNKMAPIIAICQMENKA